MSAVKTLPVPAPWCAASRVLLTASIISLLTGCPQTPSASTPPSAVPARQEPVPAPNNQSEVAPISAVPGEAVGSIPGLVELRVVDLKGYEDTIARHSGKVVLVDFWATWCAPCRQQFPHTVQLQHKFRDQGLTVLSVSIDQLEAGENLDKLQARVLDFLKGQGAIFPNLLAVITELAAGDDGATDLVTSRFDIDGGAIPHFKLYDRQGNLHRKFIVNLETGESFNPKDIDAAVEKLLAE